jgi:hypothetical protein
VLLVLVSVGAAVVLAAIGFLTSASIQLMKVSKGLAEFKEESAHQARRHHMLVDEMRDKIEDLQSQLDSANNSSDSDKETIRRYEAALALSLTGAGAGSLTTATGSSLRATVTAVRVTVYWVPEDDGSTKSARDSTERTRPTVLGRDGPGRMVVVPEAQEIQRSELRDLDRISAAYLEYLSREGSRETLEEATFAVVAQRLGAPANQVIDRNFPASRVAAPAAIAGDLSTWLNGGVYPTQVAEWAGHSVDVLLRIYAKCVVGQDELAKRRIAEALRQD